MELGKELVRYLGYGVETAWRFEGGIMGETVNLLLIMGNTHDTVTPLVE